MTPNQFGRFLAKVTPLANGCWKSSYSRNGNGYARLPSNGSYVMAHRASYEHFIGSVPLGLDLDHLCRDRACVNPTHLEPVTRRENIRRGELGELFTPEVSEKYARAKRGVQRPWTETWRANIVAATKERAAKQTHCKHGHLYVASNVYVNRDGRRSCKQCRAAATARAARKKE